MSQGASAEAKGQPRDKLGDEMVAMAVAAAKAQSEWALGFSFADMCGVGTESEEETKTTDCPRKLHYWWTSVMAAKEAVENMSSDTKVEQVISTAVAIAVKKATEQLERYKQSKKEQLESGWVQQRCTLTPTFGRGRSNDDKTVKGPLKGQNQGKPGQSSGATGGTGPKWPLSYCAAASRAAAGRGGGGDKRRQDGVNNSAPAPAYRTRGNKYQRFRRQEVEQRLQYAVVFGGVRRPKWDFHYEWIKTPLKKVTGVKVLALYWKPDGLLEVRVKSEEDLKKVCAIDGRTTKMARLGDITLEMKSKHVASQHKGVQNDSKLSTKAPENKNKNETKPPTGSGGPVEQTSEPRQSDLRQGAVSEVLKEPEADLELTVEASGIDDDLNEGEEESPSAKKKKATETAVDLFKEAGSPIEPRRSRQDTSSKLVDSPIVDFAESSFVDDTVAVVDLSGQNDSKDSDSPGAEQATSAAVCTDVVLIGKDMVSKESLETLNERNWLNDEVMSAYFALLQREDGVVAFGSTLMTKLQGENQESEWMKKWWDRRANCPIEQAEIIVTPVNAEGNHWVLIAANQKTRIITAYCSLGHNNYGKFAGHMARFLKAQSPQPEDQLEWGCSSQSLEQALQPDSNACGVFTCITAMKLAKGQEPTSYTSDQVCKDRVGRRLIESSIKNASLYDFEHVFGLTTPATDSSTTTAPHGEDIPVQDRC
eukprot:INCI19145.15.p2 GENE.INCI19145.15~~INCI19145.15.p2  ORF type:complete len:707 (+),score=85.60 INCI19145.15:157-2277(+)